MQPQTVCDPEVLENSPQRSSRRATTLITYKREKSLSVKEKVELEINKIKTQKRVSYSNWQLTVAPV